MNEIKLTSTYYLPEVISALVQEGYTLEVKRGRNEDEIIIRWASADRKTEPFDKDINVRSKDEPQTNAGQHVQRIESVGAMQTERSE